MSVYIIAEAGVNHNGDIELAKKLIDAAAEAGADAVKFQTFKAQKIVSHLAKKADYQLQTTGDQGGQLEMLKRLELNREQHEILMAHCAGKEITFLSTPFDLESARMLRDMGMDTFKIPSGEITNLPLLRELASYKASRYIISTGVTELNEIRDVIQVFMENRIEKKMLTILHCNTEYPSPFEDVNLKAMLTIENEFKVDIGYSDHTLGIEVPIAAVAMGAKVIEKHFTLDNKMEGPDHQASLEPAELKKMVSSIRNISKALGSGVKTASKSEIKNKTAIRKSIVASRDIAKGEIFSSDNITTKRPGNGISPMLWDKVMGQKASRNFNEDDLIELNSGV